MISRRKFLGTTALAVGGVASGLSAKSYAKVLGANDKIHFAHAGLNSRINAHLSALKSFKDRVEIVALCDVDSRLFAKIKDRYQGFVPSSAKEYEDFRAMVEDPNIDAVTIASPDHWHAPMGIIAMNAGKNVYLEKPCSHNPQESLWLQETQKKTGKTLQIGNQQRSAPTSIRLIDQLRNGVIGTPYYAKTWYESQRGTIGTGKIVDIPDWLNWDLYQGPAMRQEYKDNIVHYNWHWLRNFGTGEISNNGLHEMDIARWALNVDIPSNVTSSGGRFAFKDDWEFYDTQNASFDYGGGKMITWEGRSCNGHNIIREHGGRGTYIFGTEGTAVVDRGGYTIFDRKKKVVKQEKEGQQVDGTNTMGISGLDNYHFQNFLNAMTKGEKLNSPIEEAVKSTLMCHLGNMAQRYGGSLEVDGTTGKPKSKSAMQDWQREYHKGWKPKV